MSLKIGILRIDNIFFALYHKPIFAKGVVFVKSKFSKYRYHNGKRWVGGTAAYNHFFKENGGIDNVLERVAEESARYAVQKVLKSMKAAYK